jgi:hypothetical protein
MDVHVPPLHPPASPDANAFASGVIFHEQRRVTFGERRRPEHRALTDLNDLMPTAWAAGQRAQQAAADAGDAVADGSSP